jgi:hypothetical protein
MLTGVALARSYFDEIVAPRLAGRFTGMPYAAGRLGSGSDVLGLDDSVSRDHDWGLRLTLLVPPEAVTPVDEYLEQALPPAFAGLPVRFATTWEPAMRHRVEVSTAEDFVASRLGLDASGDLKPVDWLALTGQSLLEVTAGPVFTDSLGTLTDLRRKLAWYPEPVWRYVVAADWIRLGEDLPLLGRTAQRGDDVGSRVLTGRIAGTAMHLAFMLARQWPPYPKWAGTMLARLPVANTLIPALSRLLSADHQQHRQEAVVDVLSLLASAQQEAGLPVPPDGVAEPFFERPFLGICGETVSLLSSESDPVLPPGVGAIDQWADNVRVLKDPDRRVRLARAVFGPYSTSSPSATITADPESSAESPSLEVPSAST